MADTPDSLGLPTLYGRIKPELWQFLRNFNLHGLGPTIVQNLVTYGKLLTEAVMASDQPLKDYYVGEIAFQLSGIVKYTARTLIAMFKARCSVKKYLPIAQNILTFTKQLLDKLSPGKFNSEALFNNLETLMEIIRNAAAAQNDALSKHETPYNFTPSDTKDLIDTAVQPSLPPAPSAGSSAQASSSAPTTSSYEPTPSKSLINAILPRLSPLMRVPPHTPETIQKFASLLANQRYLLEKYLITLKFNQASASAILQHATQLGDLLIHAAQEKSLGDWRHTAIDFVKFFISITPPPNDLDVRNRVSASALRTIRAEGGTRDQKIIDAMSDVRQILFVTLLNLHFAASLIGTLSEIDPETQELRRTVMRLAEGAIQEDNVIADTMHWEPTSPEFLLRMQASPSREEEERHAEYGARTKSSSSETGHRLESHHHHHRQESNRRASSSRRATSSNESQRKASAKRSTSRERSIRRRGTTKLHLYRKKSVLTRSTSSEALPRTPSRAPSRYSSRARSSRAISSAETRTRHKSG